ncbi:MAG TPA: CPBP family intramembrane glutamic endopeptidase [Vicinamibacterales bacterium]|nr:CPBP family intramembrane glutamic endopeptidase [Vicinamibacterales bacterium]
MTSLKSFVGRHPVASYFVLTFAISWGGALLAVGGSGGMRGTTPGSDPRFAYALFAMLAGPALSGLFMTALLHGRSGLAAFASRLIAWRAGARWYAALLIAPAAIAAALAALSSVSRGFLPGIVTSDDPLSLLLTSLAVGVAAGIFEELGWTGFAIPALRRTRGMVSTGFIVGILWSAWHLFPNIWSARSAAGDLPMSIHMTGIAAGIFIGYLTAYRIVMVWVYDATGSILIGMLMHVSITFSLLALNPLGISGLRLLVFSFSFAAALWIAVALVALMNREPGRQPWRRLIYDAQGRHGERANARAGAEVIRGAVLGGGVSPVRGRRARSSAGSGGSRTPRHGRLPARARRRQ